MNFMATSTKELWHYLSGGAILNKSWGHISEPLKNENSAKEKSRRERNN